MTQLFTVQSVSERPLIDTLADDDSLLVLDASDNNSTKRVLVSELPISGNAASLEWDDILNKPLAFTPTNHSHEINDGSIAPSKLSQPLTSSPTVSPLGVSVVDFAIPSWASIIVCSMAGISLSGSENLNFRLGSLGVPKPTGYLGTSSIIQEGTIGIVSHLSASFPILFANSENVIHGSITFTAVDKLSNTWVANGSFCTSAFLASISIQGSVVLDEVLDILRVFAPTNTFDGGKLNVSYL